MNMQYSEQGQRIRGKKNLLKKSTSQSYDRKRNDTKVKMHIRA